MFADGKKCTLMKMPACGNRQPTKRSATAKQMHAATGLTVLALLACELGQRPTCEPASKCKQCVNEGTEWSEKKGAGMRSLTTNGSGLSEAE